MVVKATGEVVLEGRKIKFKEGALHRQLKIPEDENIGVSNLRKIKKAEVGAMVKIKGKTFKVTPLMKKRAVFGLNILPKSSKRDLTKSKMKSAGKESKGDKSKTHKGDMDYTTKKGNKDFHRGGKDVKLSRRPY